MIWLSIILGIIESIPTLISIFKEIAGWLTFHPFHVGEFQHLLMTHKDNKDVAAVAHAFRGFHAKVGAAVAAGAKP